MRDVQTSIVILGSGILSGTFLGMLCYQFWHWIFWNREGAYSGFKKEYSTESGIRKGRPNVRYIMDMITEREKTDKNKLGNLYSKFFFCGKNIREEQLLQLSQRIYDKFLYEKTVKEIQDYIRRHWAILHFRNVCIWAVPSTAIGLSIIFFGALFALFGPPSLGSSLFLLLLWASIPILWGSSYAGLRDVRNELDQFEVLLVLEKRKEISKMIEELSLPD
jgi:hypothetical protein